MACFCDLPELSVDILQVSHYLLDVLLFDEVGRRAELMDNAPLQTTAGIYSLDGVHHVAISHLHRINRRQNFPDLHPGYDG